MRVQVYLGLLSLEKYKVAFLANPETKWQIDGWPSKKNSLMATIMLKIK